jgi:hypothetical protein
MRLWLRDRYVGAVLIAFLLYNSVTSLVRAIENPILLAIQRWAQHSALSAGQPWFNKGQVLTSVVDALLFLVVSILLALWIFRSDRRVETPVKA